jgi:hypothetical protein
LNYLALKTIYLEKPKIYFLKAEIARCLNSRIFKYVNYLILFTFLMTLTLVGLMQEDHLEIIDINFYIYFTSVWLLRIASSSPRSYLKGRRSHIDTLATVLTTLEKLIINIPTLKQNEYRGISRYLYAAKVLRIFSLLRAIPFSKMIGSILSKSINSFIYLAALILVITVAYAIFGMKLFKHQFDSTSEEYLMYNFDTFFGSFTSVFSVMMLDNWQILLYEGWKSSQGPIVTTLYIISWMFVGNFLLLNLFQAIVLDEFADGIREFYEEKNFLEFELGPDEEEVFIEDTPESEILSKKGEDILSLNHYYFAAFIDLQVYKKYILIPPYHSEC